MRIFLYSICLLIIVILPVSTKIAQNYVMTFVRLECMQLNKHTPSINLEVTELSDSVELVFTHYSRITNIRLQNLGGHQVIRCEAHRFPEGVSVSVARDGSTCEISGVPTIPQGRTNAYVVAVNKQGSSLAVVPISVNALVLR